MISWGAIGSFCALTLIFISALMDDWNQTSSPALGTVTSVVTMEACTGKMDLIADGFCDEGNNSQDCGERIKSTQNIFMGL